MPPVWREGERVTVELPIGDPQPGEIIACSEDAKSVTVRVGGGLLGPGEMPLTWISGNDYALLAGGKATVRKLS